MRLGPPVRQRSLCGRQSTSPRRQRTAPAPPEADGRQHEDRDADDHVGRQQPVVAEDVQLAADLWPVWPVIHRCGHWPRGRDPDRHRRPRRPLSTNCVASKETGRPVEQLRHRAVSGDRGRRRLELAGRLGSAMGASLLDDHRGRPATVERSAPQQTLRDRSASVGAPASRPRQLAHGGRLARARALGSTRSGQRLAARHAVGHGRRSPTRWSRRASSTAKAMASVFTSWACACHACRPDPQADRRGSPVDHGGTAGGEGPRRGSVDGSAAVFATPGSASGAGVFC